MKILDLINNCPFTSNKFSTTAAFTGSADINQLETQIELCLRAELFALCRI